MQWKQWKRADAREAYFAVTVGLKDAWCIAGADRKIGDVHGGRGCKGGWKVGGRRRVQACGRACGRVDERATCVGGPTKGEGAN